MSIEATLRNMREHAGEHGLTAFSPATGEQCSADYRDYFQLAEDDPLVDENGQPMILVHIHESMTILEQETKR